jgi:aspartyl-tRNA(Asn)/glutamyl-tRNA(Gln) amidotransferase subunit C
MGCGLLYRGKSRLGSFWGHASKKTPFPRKLNRFLHRLSLCADARRFYRIRKLNPHLPAPFTSFPTSMSAELDVRNTAKLARLELSEAETSRFQTQLSQVLSYVEKLKEVDVTGIEPTAHTSEVQNVFRADEPRDWFSAQEALSNAPRQANGLFVVSKVIE